MKVAEFEKKVWDLDGVRVVIRAATKEKVANYTNKNAVQKGTSVTDYLTRRIGPLIDPYTAVVVGGAGNVVNGKTLINSVRESYKKDNK